MQNDVILQIANRIKEKRKDKKITLEKLAEQAGVTKGLISQIENNRTVPSLGVLLNIIKALNVDFNEFFDKLHNGTMEDILFIPSSEYELLQKEYSAGSIYKRILSFKHQGGLVDVVLYRQEIQAERGFVSTNAFEFNYIIRGRVKYTIEEKSYVLEEGDSFYYDARKPHLSTCLSEPDYLMLVIYFFEEEHS